MLMNGYKDAHTHIHPSATATKAFMNAMKFPGPWDGTIEQALPIMDKAGIATTLIVPLIADAVLLADRMEEEAKRVASPIAIASSPNSPQSNPLTTAGPLQ